MIKQEIWNDIPGYEGLYQASNMGKIRSLKRTTTSGKILKTYINTHNGYVYATLSKNNIKNSKRVHRLIMNAFYPFQGRNMQINHIDGDKTNNSLYNLEFCTASENMQHAYKNGLVHIKGREIINTDTGVVYASAAAAVRDIGGKKSSSILRVCNGERSQYRNHHFVFYDDYKKGITSKFHGKYTKKSSEELWK